MLRLFLDDESTELVAAFPDQAARMQELARAMRDAADRVERGERSVIVLDSNNRYLGGVEFIPTATWRVSRAK